MSSNLIRPGYQTARLNFPPKKDFYITAYVEGLSDINFWREVFKKCSPIEVKPSTNDGSANGKESLLKNLSNTGKDIIICLDSDFDYLIPNRSIYANIINNHKCIFQTYAHSMENFLCYAKSLDELCKNITLNNLPSIEFKFEEFFRKFSKKIYEPFTYYIYLKSIKANKTFESKDFDKLIRLDSSSLSKADNIDQLNQLLDTILGEMELKLIEKVIDLEVDYSSLYDFSKELKNDKNVRPDEMYLFIKGHVLFKSITMPLLRKIVYIYSKEKMKNIIEGNKGKAQEIENKLKQYQKKLCPSRFELNKLVGYDDFHEHSSLAKRLYSRLEDKLKGNYKFYECYLMSKIKKDIDIFIDEYYPS